MKSAMGEPSEYLVTVEGKTYRVKQTVSRKYLRFYSSYKGVNVEDVPTTRKIVDTLMSWLPSQCPRCGRY